MQAKIFEPTPEGARKVVLATNIAETLYYAVKGENLPEARPKGDTSAYAVVRPKE